MADFKKICWDSFSIASGEFQEAIQDESVSRLLYEYFTFNKVPNNAFLLELASNYPFELIQGVRTSQAFFNENHLKSLDFFKDHHNPYLSGHFKVFTKLASLEQELYSPFVQSLNETDSIDVLEVMTVISLWFEKVRASLFENGAAAFQYDLSIQIDVINFVLTHYLFRNRELLATIDLPQYSDIYSFADVFKKFNTEAKLTKHPVWQTLDKAFIYYFHLTGTFEAYSFDMNYDISISETVIELKYSDREKWNNWHRNEAKVSYWYHYYRSLAAEYVTNQMFENPNFIKDTSGFDFDMNLEGNIRSVNAFLVAKDYCLDESMLLGVPNRALIGFLNGFVSNAYGRFISPIDDLNMLEPENWLQHIFNVFYQFGLNEKASVPLRLCSQLEFRDIAVKNVTSSEMEAETLINLLSTDLSKMEYLNRLNPMVNLVSKPFIKVGNYYLAFNGILGESNSQANLLMNIMDGNSKAHRNVEKQEVEKLEEQVALMFKEAGYKNVAWSKFYKSGNSKGDFDILVYLDGVLLIIELKRSKIRTTLSDAYFEYENSLLKASKQLDKAINYICSNFEKFKNNQGKDLGISETSASDLKIYPIIVSTSFEHDHVLIRGKHLKISLFELQNTLLAGVEQINENQLESLIYVISSDRYWDSIVGEVSAPDMDNWTLTF